MGKKNFTDESILVIGAGSLAKVYGGFLRRLGLQVTCLVRNREKAEHSNWVLEDFSGKRFEVTGVRFIESLSDVEIPPKMILVTTRKENLKEVLKQLKSAQLVDVPVFIFPPLIDLEDLPGHEHFSSLHVVIPGVVSYPDKNVESFTAKRTIVTTLRGASDRARILVNLMKAAGLPAVFSKNYLHKILLPSFALILTFALIELAEANYKKLARDSTLLAFAAQVLDEIARGIKNTQKGAVYGINYFPNRLIRSCLSLAMHFLPGKYQAMLAYHTRKVSVQTRQILKTLSERLESQGQSTTYTRDLLSRLVILDTRGNRSGRK